MSGVHRNNDSRVNGATTIVTGQSTVFVNGKLVAVEGDQDSFGNGQLIATKSSVTINGKKIILQNDNAQPDNQPYANPSASSGSGNVTA